MLKTYYLPLRYNFKSIINSYNTFNNSGIAVFAGDNLNLFYVVSLQLQQKWLIN